MKSWPLVALMLWFSRGYLFSGEVILEMDASASAFLFPSIIILAS
jgi:hypothetical protein